MPATQSLVLTGTSLTGVTVATDCDAPGCATPPNGQLRLGSADGHLWAVHLKADLTALPVGARVTSAKLSLTRADCTTACEAQKPEAFELSTPWTATQSGKDLLTAAGSDSYVSDLALSEVDFGMLVQSWIDRGKNEGLALTVPGTVAGASYHSGAAADPALRPKLTVEYLPPTAPGAVSEVVTTPGDTGLLATWNAPLDGGTTGDVTYVAKAEKSDGTVVGTWEGTALRAVFSGLNNATSYRVSVTAKNAVGSGPVSRSALAQGASVLGGTTPYKDYVQAYLSARNKVTTGVRATTAEAAAESPHGAVFGAVLDVQEASLIGGLVALGTQNQAYVGASSALTDTMIANGGADRVLVRTTVIQTMTLRVNGVDEVSEDRRAKRFVFTVSGGTVKLESESDDSEAGQKLSATAAAGTQVAATPADITGVPTDGAESILLGEDGFPVSDPSAAGALTASYVNGSGTASWAWNYAGRIPREYGTNDCTNFVSKALYNGGGMKMRHWAYWQDRAWWRNTSWTSWKKNSHTWSAAQNLFQHMFNYRQPGYVNRVYNLRPGDILFFEWKKDNGVHNHAAVVTGNNQGVVSVAQHGYNPHDTLQAIMARNRTGPNPIVGVSALRPRSR
ncbi:amidase domain-containing protein [Streptomyces sp. NBC_00029]|uniref:amidase domain-containing protein n=1 Tax=Streptomyces sp. NBC_00029 TaxID=2903613 RepID=UPI003243342F